MSRSLPAFIERKIFSDGTIDSKKLLCDRCAACCFPKQLQNTKQLFVGHRGVRGGTAYIQRTAYRVQHLGCCPAGGPANDPGPGASK